MRGASANSVFHSGFVGINTDSPDEALCIRGNIKLTGSIMQPSDRRVKQDITPLDTSSQLQNVRKLGLYRYRLSDSWGEHVGREGKDAEEWGVLAQELQQVMPEAVRETGDQILKDGSKIENLLVVNKERIFVENIGAVQELGKLTDRLEDRLNKLESENKVMKAAVRRSSSLLELKAHFSRIESGEIDTTGLVSHDESAEGSASCSASSSATVTRSASSASIRSSSNTNSKSVAAAAAAATTVREDDDPTVWSRLTSLAVLILFALCFLFSGELF